MARCPFHQSKSGKSFSVNLDTGGFCCFGCPAKGGDIVAFVMFRDHCDFRTACKALGAWRDVSDDERRRIELQNALRQKQKEEKTRVDQVAHAERIRLRDEIHLLVSIQAETSSRLSELLSGAECHYPDEASHCWGILALICDDLRDCESAYMVAAGLEEAA
jgi:hypothetical protein